MRVALTVLVAILLVGACGGKDEPALTMDVVDAGTGVETVDGGKEVCTPNCEGKECGSNGCNGDCGTCKFQLETCTDEGLCEPTSCDSTKDCPGDLLCNKDLGQCVVCVGDEDCPGGQTCGADNECHEEIPCQSDLDCKDLGLICDKDDGKCVECLGSEDCADEQYCLETYCVDDICTAGESYCDGLDVTTCNDEGSAEEVTKTCTEIQYCEAGQCLDLVCTPDDQWCDDDIAKKCASDGKSVESETDCSGSDQFCLDGVCLNCTCEPGATLCDGDFTMVECADNCVDTFGIPCDPQKSCSAGSCVSWLCEPGSVFCDGDVYKVCSGNGLSIQYEKNCADKDKYCSVNGCADSVCPPLEKFCFSNTQYALCAADGMTYQAYDCPGQHYCEGGECLAWVCEPTVASCSENVAKTCNPQGSGFLNVVDCGEQGKSCADGVCLDCIPQCDGKECGDNGCDGTCGVCDEPAGADCVAGILCVEGACTLEVQQFFCFVEESCVPSGTENPDNSCDKCQPNDSQIGWSPVGDGMPCSGGLTCHDGVCCDFDCTDKQCGPDGCGGFCGDCQPNVTCVDGLCLACDDGNDVDWDGCTNGQITEFGLVFEPSLNTPQIAVSVDAADRYMVTWSRQDKVSPPGIYYQLFDESGQAVCGQTQTNSSDAVFGRGIALTNSNWVVVWSGAYENSGIFGQLVSSEGLKIGNTFDVNSSSGDGLAWPAVAPLQDGGFVVAWGVAFSPKKNLYQRFNAQGDKVGSEQTLDSNGGRPSIDVFSDGSLVAAWRNGEIFCRLFDDTGQPLTDKLSVNETTDGNQEAPSVSVLGGDKFVVAWHSPIIKYQLFDELAEKTGGENTASTLSNGKYPAVASLHDGEFAVAWHSWDTILLGRYSQDGPLGEEVEVNVLKGAPPLSDGMRPSIAAFSDGGLIVVWPLFSNGIGYSAYAQRFDKDGNKFYH